MGNQEILYKKRPALLVLFAPLPNIYPFLLGKLNSIHNFMKKIENEIDDIAFDTD